MPDGPRSFRIPGRHPNCNATKLLELHCAVLFAAALPQPQDAIRRDHSGAAPGTTPAPTIRLSTDE